MGLEGWGWVVWAEGWRWKEAEAEDGRVRFALRRSKDSTFKFMPLGTLSKDVSSHHWCSRL